MGHEKAIKSGKEHRKPFRGSKVWDCSCRNHGSCSYCLSNRMHSHRKNRMKLDGQEAEFVDHELGGGDPQDATTTHFERLEIQADILDKDGFPIEE